MASYFIKTFGCQMNIADSETLQSLLRKRGFEKAPEVQSADLIIVNTCSIREKAEQKAMGMIREYGAHKRKNGLLWVVGCMAQRCGEDLIARIPQIDRIIGTEEIEYIEEHIDMFLSPLGVFDHSNAIHSCVWNIFLPIMRGCDNFCTYCIVPHVRGREHSIPTETLLTQAESMIANGAVEITLLGQNVNSYSDGDIDFPDLLKKIAALPNLKRLRFTTSHPKDISQKLIETIAETPILCNHIHLPVQSGSTKILDQMSRVYTRKQYLEKIELIREILPNADITTDAMVGFPGETEQEFQETMSLFEHVRYTTAFMFAYSPREGTAAAQWDDQVSKEEKATRLTTLITLQTEITRQIYDAMVGKTVSVLFVLKQERNGIVSWLGQDYGIKRVVVETNKDLGGKIYPVHIIRNSGMTLIGEVIL